jgi:chorismate mutase
MWCESPSRYSRVGHNREPGLAQRQYKPLMLSIRSPMPLLPISTLRRRHKPWLGLALVALVASGCATTASFTAADTAAVDRLLGLIKERLDVAPDVARTKWNSKAPVEDLPREKQIIDGVAEQATAYGLDPAIAAAFFRGQIAASKAVQSMLHAEWTASGRGPYGQQVDLERDIRPVLDRLTPTMLRALAEALPVVQQPGGRQLLDAHSSAILATVPGGAIVVREAVAPLRQLSR